MAPVGFGFTGPQFRDIRAKDASRQKMGYEKAEIKAKEVIAAIAFNVMKTIFH